MWKDLINIYSEYSIKINEAYLCPVQSLDLIILRWQYCSKIKRTEKALG